MPRVIDQIMCSTILNHSLLAVLTATSALGRHRCMGECCSRSSVVAVDDCHGITRQLLVNTLHPMMVQVTEDLSVVFTTKLIL